MKNELKLLSERLNVTKTLFDRINSEYKNVNSRIDKAEKEIFSGNNIEKSNRLELGKLALEIKEFYTEESRLRAEISKHDSEFSDARKKTSKIRRKIDRNKTDISAVNAELSILFSNNNFRHL